MPLAALMITVLAGCAGKSAVDTAKEPEPKKESTPVKLAGSERAAINEDDDVTDDTSLNRKEPRQCAVTYVSRRDKLKNVSGVSASYMGGTLYFVRVDGILPNGKRRITSVICQKFYPMDGSDGYWVASPVDSTLRAVAQVKLSMHRANDAFNSGEQYAQENPPEDEELTDDYGIDYSQQ